MWPMESFVLGALALLFIPSTSLVSAKGLYVVLIPRVVHPGWPLNIAVSIHRTTSTNTPVTIKATLSDSQSVETEASMAINAGESKLLSLLVPEPPSTKPRIYDVRVQGFGGLNFDESQSVAVNANTSILLVQTDKNMYKPGQLVRFRVINVDKDLAPVSDSLTAFIMNTKGSRLERYNNLTSNTGVVSREFQLSDYASLGLWRIQLQNEKEEVLYDHSFEIDEYVLPKFSVEVTPDPDFLIWGIYNQPPGIIIKSMYTYGKAVQGECFLTLRQMGSSYQQQLSQKIPDSGVVEFYDINWSSLVGSKPRDSKQLLAQVEVKDIMGRSEYGEARINIFRGDFKVEILPQSPEIIHSGLETEIFVKVSDHYNNPVAGKEVDVTLEMPSMSPLTVRIRMEEGKAFASLKFTPVWQRSSDNNNREASSSTFYGDLEGSLKAALVGDNVISDEKQVYWYYSINQHSIRFEGPKKISVPRGQPHTMQVTRTLSSSFPSSTMYTIVSQGVILETGVVSGDEVTVTPTFDMCPKARLIVYQLLDSSGFASGMSEVLADSIELAPTLCMDKQVQVTFDTREQRTGSDANLQIKVGMKDGSAMPNQIHDVFYLAVDKSIVILQGDTSMTDNKIMDALYATNSWSKDDTQNTATNVFDHFDVGVGTNAAVADTKIPEIMYARAFDVGMRRKNGPDADVVADEEDKESTKAPESAPQQKIRKDFPDTWLWMHGQTTEAGWYRTQVRLPDTITSWHVTAFGVNENGIVGSGTPFELTAFNPFFVSLNLPYSIKRGEVFSLRVTVFNYRPQDVTAIIRLELSDDFIITGGQPKDNYMEHAVNMLPNLASVVTYEVNASTIGKINFHVVAQDVEDPNQRDEVIRELLVKPPGEERDEVTTDVLLLVDQGSLTKRFDIAWPYDNIIMGSQRLQLKVTGQVLGQSLANLKNLVRQPTGCGEQNMIGLVPNIYGATYIDKTDQHDSKDLVTDMIKNMNTGYQRQVDLYQKDDGSYSAWATDATGSTWLTAFVMKSFAAATEFIPVESDVLRAAMSFLSLKQERSGFFKEDGRLLHKDLQAGTSDDLPLTVYCLLSILETAEVTPFTELEDMLDISIPLILTKTSEMISRVEDSAFLPAMTAYTLSLAAQHDSSLQLDEQINALLQAVVDRSAPWEQQTTPRPSTSSSSTTSHSSHNSPTLLMTAAYTLMAHLKQNDIGKAFDVMKWLQAKQNSKGGFGSTQDTVLVLQSLSEFGIYYKNVDATGQVEVTVPDTDFRESLDISGSRSILLQQVDLPVDTVAVDVTLTGETNTVAFVKLVSTYNTPVTSVVPMSGSDQSSRGVDLKTSSRYFSDAQTEIEACVFRPGVGMYVASMNLASGEVNCDSASQMKARNPIVNQVEVGEGVVHFYMNDIPKEGDCLKFCVEKQVEFSEQQPGSATLYSYYEPSYFIEKELAVVDETNQCQGGGCGRAQALPVASLVLTILICFMASLLACL